ncbi:MAG: hypothetical protein ACRDKW_14850 [Actinomycetota bacterium]
MGYLIFAVAMAAVLITVLALRDRISRSPGRSVDAFKRAIVALTPNDQKAEDASDAELDAAKEGEAKPGRLP